MKRIVALFMCMTLVICAGAQAPMVKLFDKVRFSLVEVENCSYFGNGMIIGTRGEEELVAVGLDGSCLALKGYDDARVNGHYIAVWKGDQCGLISRRGKLLLPCEFDTVLSTMDNLAVCTKRDDDRTEYYVFDLLTGKEVELPGGHTGVIEIRDGKILRLNKVNDAARYTIFDRAGNNLTESLGYTMGDKYNGYTVVYDTKSYLAGVIDSAGNRCMPCAFTDILSVAGGVALVRSGRYYGIADLAGKMIVPAVYIEGELGFSGVSALYDEEGDMHLFNQRGELITAPGRFEKMGNSYDNIVLVSKNRLWGAITCDGHELTPFVFTDFDYARDLNQLYMKDYSKTTLLRDNGEILFKMRPGNEISCKGEYLIKTEFNGKRTVMDSNLHVLLSGISEDAEIETFPIDGCFMVRDEDGLSRFYHNNGKCFFQSRRFYQYFFVDDNNGKHHLIASDDNGVYRFPGIVI